VAGKYLYGEFVRAHYDAETIRGLEDDLRLADDRSSSSAIEWTMRQVAFHRA
jgi:hypothetical protein